MGRTLLHIVTALFGYGRRLRRLHRMLYACRDRGSYAAVGLAAASAAVLLYVVLATDERRRIVAAQCCRFGLLRAACYPLPSLLGRSVAEIADAGTADDDAACDDAALYPAAACDDAALYPAAACDDATTRQRYSAPRPRPQRRTQQRHRRRIQTEHALHSATVRAAALLLPVDASSADAASAAAPVGTEAQHGWRIPVNQDRLLALRPETAK